MMSARNTLAIVSACLSLVALVALSSAAGTLYGFTETSNAVLVSYDPTCGVSKQVASFPSFALHTDDQCVMDGAGGILYANGFNLTSSQNLVLGVNVLNGAIESTTPLPPSFTGVKIAFNPNNGQLVVTGQNASNPQQPWVTLTMKPGSSSWTQVATFNKGFIDVLGGPNAFDPNTSIQWISMGISNSIMILGVNVNTGQLYNVTDTGMMETMDWDSSTNSVVGVGLQVTGRTTTQRTLVSFTSQNITDTTYANISGGWYMLDGGGSAVDSQSRTLYTIMSIGDESPLEFLVSVNLNTGATTGAAFLPSLAPWCLGLLPSSAPSSAVKAPASVTHASFNTALQATSSPARRVHQRV